MEPEEIDKLFKNRLGDLSVPPSADAWMRLQAKMVPPKKERTMWIYYVAASVLILFVSGLLLFRNNNTAPETTVAQTIIVKPSEKKPENLLTPQATAVKPSASTKETITDADIPAKANSKVLTSKPSLNQKTLEPKTVLLAQVRKNKKEKEEKPVLKAITPVKPPINKEEELVAHHQNNNPAETPVMVIAKSPATLGVVQVIVKMDDAADQTPVNPGEATLRENINRKGILLKNIYKQARNLKNGEPVELATLGLDPEKINAEKENIKQKINKVISL